MSSQPTTETAAPEKREAGWSIGTEGFTPRTMKEIEELLSTS